MLSGTRVPPPQLDEFFLTGDRRIARVELAEAGIQIAGPPQGGASGDAGPG